MYEAWRGASLNESIVASSAASKRSLSATLKRHCCDQVPQCENDRNLCDHVEVAPDDRKTRQP